MSDRVPSVLVVCGYPPNAIDGGGILLRGLLSSLPADKLTVVTSAYMLRWLASRARGADLLEGSYVPIASPLSDHAGARVALGPINPAMLPSIARTVSAQAARHDVILTLPWGNSLGAEMFVAAYLAHQRTGTPLVVYELDEWRASLCLSSGPFARLLERRYHHRIVRAAHTVWAVSEPMADELHERFGITARALSHSVAIPPHPRAVTGQRSEAGIRILFTGSVSGPQAGAIGNVLRAIEENPKLRAELLLYTNQSRRELERHGIAGDALRIEAPVPVAEIPQVLASGDVLLLPFSFDARQRPVVSTSMPTKTADYLISGVPILVHAPPYASIARASAEGGWAEVVTDPDPAALAATLGRLASDVALRVELASRALDYARAHHDRAERSREFLASLSEAALTRSAPVADAV